jgi:predicted phosphodiesterase
MIRIADIYRNGSQAQFLDEAIKLGTNTQTLGRQCRNFHTVSEKLRAKYMAAAIPDSTTPVYDQYTIVNTDNAIVISDIEVPDHDPRILRLALLAGMKHGIKTLILAGDIIATDQDALNSWLTTWADGEGKTYAQCLAELKGMIRAMAEWFTDGIYAIQGNHDERVARKTGGQITLKLLLEGEPVDYSMYGYLYLHFPNGEYTYIAHQYAYSKTPVRLAQQIWEVESAPDGSKAKMHIVVTHTHIQQEGWSPDANWRCISLGCMRDP